MSIVVDRWPDHKGSLHLTHNQHKSYYETVEEAIQSGTYLENYWVSQAQKEKAIATDCVWELQWYPNTPVSFSLRIACDLDALLEAQTVPSVATPSPADRSRGPADQIVGEIEALFPNWRSYRDLVDCITCELHELRKRAEGGR